MCLNLYLTFKKFICKTFLDDLIMTIKAEFVCKTCNLILSDPVVVPCSCGTTCKSHLDELVANTQLTSVTCKHCHHTFDIPQPGGFVVDDKLRKSIEKDAHLSENQKKLKKAFGDSIKGSSI